MKKKLLALTIVPFLLTSCSLLGDIFGGVESSLPTSESSNQTSSGDTSVVSSDTSHTSIVNERPHIIFNSEGFTYDEETGNYLISVKRGRGFTLTPSTANSRLG